MSTVLLRLAGPAQNYAGYRALAHYGDKAVNTAAVPSKSAVTGLIGAALGTTDLHPLNDAYRLDVRVDRTNAATPDRQVLTKWDAWPEHAKPARDRSMRLRGVTGFGTRSGAGNEVSGGALVDRMFLPHAEFICALTTPDLDTAAQWCHALHAPTFMTYLGRRANAPTFPLILGYTTTPADELFNQLPYVPRADDPDTVRRAYHITGGYTHHATRLYTTTPPATTREDQLTWATTNLTR